MAHSNCRWKLSGWAAAAALNIASELRRSPCRRLKRPMAPSILAKAARMPGKDLHEQFLCFREAFQKLKFIDAFKMRRDIARLDIGSFCECGERSLMIALSCGR